MPKAHSLNESKELAQAVSLASKKNRLSFEDFRLLLLQAGVSLDDSYDFFVYGPDGLNEPPIAISEKLLAQRFVLEPLFYKKFLQILDPSLKDEQVVFTLQYDAKKHRISINGQQIKKFNDGSQGEKYFEEIYNASPNSWSKPTAVTRATYALVNSFGFKDKAGDIFFPAVTSNSISVRRLVTRHDLKVLGLEEVTVQELFP